MNKEKEKIIKILEENNINLKNEKDIIQEKISSNEVRNDQFNGNTKKIEEILEKKENINDLKILKNKNEELQKIIEQNLDN